MTYTPFALLTGNEGVGIWTCDKCGALVNDQRRHDMWHVNVIGGLQAASDPRNR